MSMQSPSVPAALICCTWSALCSLKLVYHLAQESGYLLRKLRWLLSVPSVTVNPPVAEMISGCSVRNIVVFYSHSETVSKHNSYAVSSTYLINR
jgi:hypothetical protein